MSNPAKKLKGRAARLARWLPNRPNKAARTPFVLLVVLLLGGGLISLLVLNSALNAGSFQLSKYEKRNTELTDEEQALQRGVDDRSVPGALAKRAAELGMVPGGGPVFLNPDGTVRGVPSEATAQPARHVPHTPESSATPDATPDPAPPVTSEVSLPLTQQAAAAPGGVPAFPALPAPAGTTTEPTPTPGR